jgi:DNA-binding CsgD family transcriptional regulator
MAKVEDFFIPQNRVSGIPDEDYKAANVLIRAFEAISRVTYKSMYIIDYFKKNFLYVSNNPFFLCGHTREEVMEMGYFFYTRQVPEKEQEMLVEINNAGFNFFNGAPAEERLLYAISYDFNLLTEKKKTLINHKITLLLLDSEGKVWLAACLVSLSSKKNAGNVEMRKAGQSSFWEYSFKTKKWEENSGLSLNDKEKEILSLSARGYTMTEIADKICLSLPSVKIYRINLFKKLNVNNIAEALDCAGNHKLL